MNNDVNVWNRLKYLPKTIIVFSGITILLLVLLQNINDHRVSDSIIDEIVMRFRTDMFEFHFKLEENLSGDSTYTFETILSDIKFPVEVFSQWGHPNSLINLFISHDKIGSIAAQAKIIEILLSGLKYDALIRQENYPFSGIGTPSDKEFDVAFYNLMAKIDLLHVEIMSQLDKTNFQIQLLMNIFLFAWMLLLSIGIYVSWQARLKSVGQKLEREKLIGKLHFQSIMCEENEVPQDDSDRSY